MKRRSRAAASHVFHPGNRLPDCPGLMLTPEVSEGSVTE